MNVTLPNVTKPHELRDEDIRKYIDLYMTEEIENGRDPLYMSLKDTIEVCLRFLFFLPEYMVRHKRLWIIGYN